MHEIFGNRFLGYRQPGWHQIGTVVTDRLNATQAAIQADLLVPVKTLPVPPLRVTWDGTEYELETGHQAIVRMPTADDPRPVILGWGEEGYTLLETQALCEMLDLLCDPNLNDRPMWVDACGMLRDGRQVWFCMDGGEYELEFPAAPAAGRRRPFAERHHSYFLVVDERPGGFDIAYTDWRVVCANTLTLGLSEAHVRATLQHTRNIRSDAAMEIGMFRATGRPSARVVDAAGHDLALPGSVTAATPAEDTLSGQLRAAQQASVSALVGLASRALAVTEAEEIIRRCHPDPKVPGPAERVERYLAAGGTIDEARMADHRQQLKVHAYFLNSARDHRLRAWLLYQKFNDEFPALAGTPYAVYNAIGEQLDHLRGKTTASTIEAATFGPRAQIKARAFQLCYQAAQGKVFTPDGE